MNSFRRKVQLTGCLGRDAEVPASQMVDGDPEIVLALFVESMDSGQPTGLRILRISLVPVVCPLSVLAEISGDLKEGQYIQVEGKLVLCEEDGPVVWTRSPRVMRISGIKVRASGVRRIVPSTIASDVSGRPVIRGIQEVQP